MLENLITMAWQGYNQGYMGDILQTWESWGVFYYLLPFIIIFSLVFVILSKIKLFQDNDGNSYKGINIMISFAVGLLAIFTSDQVPRFFMEIFPHVGVALAVLLSIVIVLGIFIDPENKGMVYSLMGVGVIVIIAVLYKSFDSFGTYGTGIAWGNIIPQLVIAGIIIGAIVAAVLSGPKSSKPSNGSGNAPWILGTPKKQ